MVPRERKKRRSAFTLVELLVVIAILVIVATLAMPAMGPMFASNQTAAAISTLSSLMVTAQTAARTQGTPVGLRIERAYKTNKQGHMVNAQGLTPIQCGISQPEDLDNLARFQPVWLDHQQVRIVNLTYTKYSTGGGGDLFDYLFTPDSAAGVTALPKDIWVAPGLEDVNYSLDENAAANQLWHPTSEGVKYNYFESFFVVFNSAGELARFSSKNTWYKDVSQPVTPNAMTEAFSYPRVTRPWPTESSSPRAVLLYDRKKWDALLKLDAPRREFLRREGVPLYINRNTGAVVEERR